MKPKLAVVTGPTSGIGRQIATELARQGMEVVLACRDVAKGKNTSGGAPARRARR